MSRFVWAGVGAVVTVGVAGVWLAWWLRDLFDPR